MLAPDVLVCWAGPYGRSHFRGMPLGLEVWGVTLEGFWYYLRAHTRTGKVGGCFGGAPFLAEGLFLRYSDSVGSAANSGQGEWCY